MFRAPSPAAIAMSDVGIGCHTRARGGVQFSPMGQLLLGFRSLLVKIAIFIVMAALLAWALGGALWPRPVVVHYEPLQLIDDAWYWSLSVGSERVRSDRSMNRPRWTMIARSASAGDGTPFPQEDQPAVFHEIAGPIRLDDRIAFAGELAYAPDWAKWDSPRAEQWVLFIARDRRMFQAHPMPDRLAVEQQLARLAEGLDVQDAAKILQQRPSVIDPVDSG